ncbi:hypothetical protein Aduo_000475 [Ancylostoma duodenale]
MLGKPKKVLLDTGSQISIMPLKILVAAHQEGFDLNKDVEEIPFTSSTPIYDASGDEVEFKGAIRLTIQMGQSAPQRVAMLVRKTENDMVVFGTNILSKLGLSLERKQNSGNAPETRDEAGPSRRVEKPEQNPRKLTKDKSKPAVVTSRVYIRPGETKPLVISSGTPGKDQMLWSDCEVIPDAVCHADQSVLKLPVTNTTDVPKTFRIGEEIGHWDDSWVVEHSSASHANMLERTNSDSAERKELLWKALLNNKTTTEYDEPLRGVVDRFDDLFAVFDQELTQTSLVEHDIETGSAQPIRQKARPVPLGTRIELRKILDDLVKRDIIEPSQSNWSSPIVLVRKKRWNSTIMRRLP